MRLLVWHNRIWPQSKDVDKAVRTRVRLGESPQFEAIRSGVEVLKANQSLTRAANRVRVNRVMLDTLTAGSLGSTYAIDGQIHPWAPDSASTF